jgi:hypothetical protein
MIKLTAATLAALQVGNIVRITYDHTDDKKPPFEDNKTYNVMSKYLGDYGPVNYLIDSCGDCILGITDELYDELIDNRDVPISNHYSVELWDSIYYEICVPVGTRRRPEFHGRPLVIEQRGDGYTLDISGELGLSRSHVGAYSNQSDLIAGLINLLEGGE